MTPLGVGWLVGWLVGKHTLISVMAIYQATIQPGTPTLSSCKQRQQKQQQKEFRNAIHLLGNPDPQFQSALSNFGIPEDSIP